MSEFVKPSANINSGVDKVDWTCWTQLFQQFYSKVELSFSPNATNIIFNRKPFLFRQNGFERKRQNETELVGIKLRTVYWPGVNWKPGEVLIQKYASTKNWEGSFNGISTGDVVYSGNQKPHKCLYAIKPPIKTLSKTLKHKGIYFQVHNMVALSMELSYFNISVKNRRCSEFKISPISKINMGSSSPMCDHSYCRVPS